MESLDNYYNLYVIDPNLIFLCENVHSKCSTWTNSREGSGGMK